MTPQDIGLRKQKYNLNASLERVQGAGAWISPDRENRKYFAGGLRAGWVGNERSQAGWGKDRERERVLGLTTGIRWHLGCDEET